MAELDKVFEKISEISRQKLEEVKAYQKKRFLFGELMAIASKESKLILLLTGVRGAGKTVLSLQVGNELVASGKNVLYMAADHVALSGISLYDVVERGTAYGYTHFIIDEAHSRPNWPKELKSIYDGLGVFVLATGSSTTLLKQGKYDLSRRALEISLPVMSYREMINLRFNESRKAITVDEILKNYRQLSISYRPYNILDYLSYYSLPVSLEHPPEIGRKLVFSTIEKMVYRDLPEVYHIEAETIYDAKKLLVYLATITPGETSISNLAQMLENAGKGTIKTLLTAFSQLGMAFAIPPHGKPGKKLRKSYKVLLAPPYRHIIAKAAGVEPPIGALREDFFVAHTCQRHALEYFSRKKMPDYILDGKEVFEVGGAGKTRKQLKGLKDAYLVADTSYSETKIPLHLFGYLY